MTKSIRFHAVVAALAWSGAALGEAGSQIGIGGPPAVVPGGNPCHRLSREEMAICLKMPAGEVRSGRCEVMSREEIAACLRVGQSSESGAAAPASSGPGSTGMGSSAGGSGVGAASSGASGAGAPR